MFGACRIGMRPRRGRWRRDPAPASPVVPITMAIPRSRQVFSQCRMDAGTVKSISTCGVGRRSNVIGRPIGPTPGDFAGVLRLGGMIRPLDCADDLGSAVLFGQRDQPAPIRPRRR